MMVRGFISLIGLCCCVVFFAGCNQYKSEVITITVSKDGTMAIDGKAHDSNTLASALERLESQGAFDVIIQADTTVEVLTVMKIMDLCQAAGAKEISLASSEKTTD